jgi:hypothetical protein
MNRAMMAHLKKRHPRLSNVTFQEASAPVKVENTDNTLVRNPAGARAWNCFYCGRPISRPGLMHWTVREALVSMGCDPTKVEDLALRLEPLPDTVRVPEGRVVNVFQQKDEFETDAPIIEAKTGRQVCGDRCSLALLYFLRNSNMNQCVALAGLQAMKRGVDITSIAPTVDRGRLQRFGGTLSDADATTFSRHRVHVRRLDDITFQSVDQVFSQHTVSQPGTGDDVRSKRQIQPPKMVCTTHDSPHHPRIVDAGVVDLEKGEKNEVEAANANTPSPPPPPPNTPVSAKRKPTGPPQSTASGRKRTKRTAASRQAMERHAGLRAQCGISPP